MQSAPRAAVRKGSAPGAIVVRDRRAEAAPVAEILPGEVPGQRPTRPGQTRLTDADFHENRQP